MGERGRGVTTLTETGKSIRKTKNRPVPLRKRVPPARSKYNLLDLTSISRSRERGEGREAVREVHCNHSSQSLQDAKKHSVKKGNEGEGTYRFKNREGKKKTKNHRKKTE